MVDYYAKKFWSALSQLGLAWGIFLLNIGGVHLAYAEASDCIHFYQELQRLGVVRPVIQKELEGLWQKLSDEQKIKLSQLLERLPSSSPFPQWLHKINSKAHHWRQKDIQAVIEILLQGEVQIERFLERAINNPESLSLIEKRAAFLLVAEKWWYREDIVSLQKFSTRKLRPSDFFAKGEIPLESILHSRDQVGFWRGVFQLRASTRDLAKILENTSGVERMEKLLSLKNTELKKLISDSTSALEKMRLEYEVSRITLLEKLLKNKDNWSSIISEQIASENNPRLKRLLFEQLPAGSRAVEDIAAYGIVLGGLGFAFDHFVPKISKPDIPLPLPIEETKLKPQPSQSDSDMDQAIRDFNSGKLTQEELRKKYPQLFAK